jgi:hypothetical protein
MQIDRDKQDGERGGGNGREPAVDRLERANQQHEQTRQRGHEVPRIGRRVPIDGVADDRVVDEAEHGEDHDSGAHG